MGDVVPTVFFACSDVTIWHGDSRTAWQHLPEHFVDAIVTSPPYFGLRDYGHDGQLGLEPSPDEYVADLADLLTGYGTRVLKPGGSLWLNLGDTYSGGTRSTYDTANGKTGAAVGSLRPGPGGWPAKSLLMIPERVALALISRGWILRNRVVWAKPNGMPSSVRDRLATKHEALFHLVRQPRYFYDLDAIREPYAEPDDWRAGRSQGNKWRDAVSLSDSTGLAGIRPPRNPLGPNPGDVWTIPTQPYPDAHFAVFPPELVRRPILATVPEQVCKACGTGRERLTESTPAEATRKGGIKTNTEIGRPDLGRGRPGGYYGGTSKTVGWSDCGCDAGWTSGTVLDPFFGSGTTGVMARRLGRKTVGVELSADYCALSANRFRQDVLL